MSRMAFLTSFAFSFDGNAMQYNQSTALFSFMRIKKVEWFGRFLFCDVYFMWKRNREFRLQTRGHLSKSARINVNFCIHNKCTSIEVFSTIYLSVWINNHDLKSYVVVLKVGDL